MNGKQSDSRARPARTGVPASFGRTAEEGAAPAEDFTIRGGEAIHVVVHASVIPDAESLEALRAAIREATRLGVLDGYAAALAEMDAPDEPQVDATDGASPPH